MDGNAKPLPEKETRLQGVAIATVLLLALVGEPVAAQPGRATLSVSATVVPACTVSTAPAPRFACSSGTPESVTVSTAGGGQPPAAGQPAFPPRVEDVRQGDLRIVTISY